MLFLTLTGLRALHARLRLDDFLVYLHLKLSFDGVAVVAKSGTKFKRRSLAESG